MEARKRQSESDIQSGPRMGEEANPATQSIDVSEVAHAGARPVGAAAASAPPQIPLAPAKRVQARFNPLADGVMYLVVFVGGFAGVGCRRVLDRVLSPVDGVFDAGTFVANMIACLLFAMLVEYMANATWLKRRVRQVASRGVGLGFLGGMSTMSGVMLETMEGLYRGRWLGAFGYLAMNFAGGLFVSALGVLIMQMLLARFAQGTVTSDSVASGMRQDAAASPLSGSVPSGTGGMGPGETDADGMGTGGMEVRHVKVADAAHSAAKSALEAAFAAQVAAQQAAHVAANSQSATPMAAANAGDATNRPDTNLRNTNFPDTNRSDSGNPSNASTVSGATAAVPGATNTTPNALPSFEPKPVTAEIPVAPDPITGEVR